MSDLLSVSDAAADLGLSPSRVRLLASSGDLEARRIGGRWVVERSAVERRRRLGGAGGRRFNPENAWAVLVLASGEEVVDIDPGSRSRFRRALALEGLGALSSRLERRAKVSHYRAHPGELPHLRKGRMIVASGVSAARKVGLELAAGKEIDGYVEAAALVGVVEEHALSPISPVEANVVLRAVAEDAWHFLAGRDRAPEAAIALDLIEDADPRSRAAGEELLDRLERER